MDSGSQKVQMEDSTNFDMGSLRSNLPRKLVCRSDEPHIQMDCYKCDQPVKGASLNFWTWNVHLQRQQVHGSDVENTRRGLSKCYSGKSRSFTSLADVKCTEDLKKPEIPEAKRKKYSIRQGSFPPLACRRVMSSNHFTSYVGT